MKKKKKNNLLLDCVLCLKNQGASKKQITSENNYATNTKPSFLLDIILHVWVCVVSYSGALCLRESKNSLRIAFHLDIQ